MSFLAALTFLTVLPLPGLKLRPEQLRGAPPYFPAVGLLIGVVLALLDVLLRTVLPVPVVSGLVLAAELAITGGLHLDGLADTCDGFFLAGVSPARRLDVMRDSRTGGYGVAGVVMVLLLQYAALTSLSPEIRPAALVLMALLSRWAMSLALDAFPYAREQGAASAFRSPYTLRRAGLPALFVLIVATISAYPFGPLAYPLGPLLLGMTWLVTWTASRLLISRLGGLTGDTYGAINEAVKTIVLILLLGQH